MKIIMHSDSDLTIRKFEEPDFSVELDTDEHVDYSAMQMFATSLGLCTASVLMEYGRRLEASTDNLRVRVRWGYAEDPYRIDEIDMTITWPELPDSRIDAAQRAASQCTIHNTLHEPPEISTEVTTG